MIVHFKTEEYAWLSNMYYCPVPIDGHIFPSSEHAYMSYKSDDPEWKEVCLNPNNKPQDIKTFAAKLLIKKENWKTIRLEVMERVLIAKFTQEPLRSKLIATGNQNIQEGNWWKDDFWGIDLKKEPNYGENHLGRLQMKIRDKLNKNEL
ncbi:MAG: NADAR family protein [Richelia sp. RM2_1_2]|nr:NADAR family protein [Richelia sp. RM2_1_2]